MPATIFDDNAWDDPICHARRVGLFYLHGINPGAVSGSKGSVSVEIGPPPFDSDLCAPAVTVSYLAIIPAGGETQWGNDGSGEPQGYICDHPTPADEFSHKAMTRRSVRFSLEEVAR